MIYQVVVPDPRPTILNATGAPLVRTCRPIRATDVDCREEVSEREVVGVAPTPGYLWFGGYWNWVGNRHVWVTGHWGPGRPGYYWVPRTWVPAGGGWRLAGGHWRAEGR